MSPTTARRTSGFASRAERTLLVEVGRAVGRVAGRRLHTATMIGDRVVVECRREESLDCSCFHGPIPLQSPNRPGQSPRHLRLSRYGPLRETNLSIEVESYLDPSRVDVLDLVTFQRDTIWTRQVRSYPRSNFVSEQMTCSVRDGTAIPVTVVRHQDTDSMGRRRV